jgi:hypothetical protein
MMKKKTLTGILAVPLVGLVASGFYCLKFFLELLEMGIISEGIWFSMKKCKVTNDL